MGAALASSSALASSPSVARKPLAATMKDISAASKDSSDMVISSNLFVD